MDNYKAPIFGNSDASLEEVLTDTEKIWKREMQEKEKMKLMMQLKDMAILNESPKNHYCKPFEKKRNFEVDLSENTGDRSLIRGRKRTFHTRKYYNERFGLKNGLNVESDYSSNDGAIPTFHDKYIQYVMKHKKAMDKMRRTAGELDFDIMRANKLLMEKFN